MISGKEFEDIRDYGINMKNISYFKSDDNYVLNNVELLNGEIIPLNKIKELNINEYNGAPELIYEFYKRLDLFFPKKLIPLEHNDDINEQLFNPYTIYDEDGCTYADESINMLTGAIDSYILALAICKKYKISRVTDIGCSVGLQSWFFNQNKINYTGIDSYRWNLFPFRRYGEYNTQYFIDEFPYCYLNKNELLKEAYKDSMAILFWSYANMFSDEDYYQVSQNNRDIDIKLLFENHPYVLMTLVYYQTLKDSKLINDYCKDIILFEDSEQSCYALFIRK